MIPLYYDVSAVRAAAQVARESFPLQGTPQHARRTERMRLRRDLGNSVAE